ncbi:membrane protein insertion efficiency factor YidD [Demequina sp. SO4-13]|uniref:membrane protein insertion efficiency factor YidD n=1 Tax=Demequina sp. SO4-13 TaxID=3401027 RepID=UPI003AF863B4
MRLRWLQGVEVPIRRRRAWLRAGSSTPTLRVCARALSAGRRTTAKRRSHMRTRPLGRFGSWVILVLWQGLLGPRWNSRRNVVCRYFPTCSQYGRLAMERHGLIGGARRTIRRVKRCVPANTDTCVDFP